MRFLPLTVILPAIVSAGAAQNKTSVTPDSQMGVFVQADQKTPRYSTLPGSPSATESDPLAVSVNLVESNVTVAHSRTKLSLRSLDGLPIVRAYEAASIPAITNARQRAAGTASSPTGAGKTVQPHTWLMSYTGAPGERVRVHVRLRSTAAGKDATTDIQGLARVDVGNDRSFEFQKTLDGGRYLDNHQATIGASGSLDVLIETGALLTSTGKNAAAYTMALDVSFEPVRGIISSLEPYGPACGPELQGITWVDGAKRHTRIVLEGARPSSTAILIVGFGRFSVPLPGMTCNLLTTPLALLGSSTNAAGRIITDFPTFSSTLAVDVTFQFGVRGPTALEMSKGLGFKVFEDRNTNYDHFDINHVLATGQSLAIGGLGSPVLSKSQPFTNLMFKDGLQGRSTELVPLAENFWETMSSGMSSLASQLHTTPFNNNGAGPPSKPHDVLVSVHAVQGLPYVLLKKGTQPFATGISQFKIAKFIAESQNKSYVVRCVTNVHGETDHQLYNADYAKNLTDWQADYENEIQSLGQTEPVPMLHSQMSSFTSYNADTSIIPGLQLAASALQPRKIVMVCPKYFLEYLDGVHLTSKAYRQMGEYYGKIYNRMFIEGGTWTPVQPLTAKLNGSEIRVRFHVPEPPLVLDTSRVSDPGNFGFEYWDNSASSPAIRSVRLEDEDTVLITLTAAPAMNAVMQVRYAFTGKVGAKAGPRTGARGCLRDSDVTPSRNTDPLFNWAVHSVIAVR